MSAHCCSIMSMLSVILWKQNSRLSPAFTLCLPQDHSIKTRPTLEKKKTARASSYVTSLEFLWPLEQQGHTRTYQQIPFSLSNTAGQCTTLEGRWENGDATAYEPTRSRLHLFCRFSLASFIRVWGSMRWETWDTCLGFYSTLSTKPWADIVEAEPYDLWS